MTRALWASQAPIELGRAVEPSHWIVPVYQPARKRGGRARQNKGWISGRSRWI